MAPGTGGIAEKPWIAGIAIVSVATLLTLPAAVTAPRLNDSFWIDWVWLDQFAEQLRHGVLYPRWLPLSHGGLGSPVFYYYPPLAFYLASIFVLVGLSIYGSIIAAFFAGYVLAGAAMYLWLRDEARAPLLGALLFMAAPYHTFNFYTRGALAEFIATAVLPLVMLGLRRMSQRKSGGFALTAASYGALIATHLPLALLASLFLFGPYALVRSRAKPTALFPVAAALATGIAVAGVSLIPALLLDSYRDSASMWQKPSLQPQYWSLWNSKAWQSNGFRTVLVIVLSLEIPLLVLIWRHRSRWAMAGAACGLIAVGILPAIWALPGLGFVQFPFRLLPIAEFALATAAAFVPWGLALLPLAWIPLLWAVLATSAIGNEGVSVALLQRLHPDVPENLPPGGPRLYTSPSRWALGIAQRHRAPQFAGGTTIEPTFYFPASEVRCAGRQVPTFADPATGLLAYRGKDCARILVRTAPERAGAMISAFALLIILLSLLRRRTAPHMRRRKR